MVESTLLVQDNSKWIFLSKAAFELVANFKIAYVYNVL